MTKVTFISHLSLTSSTYLVCFYPVPLFTSELWKFYTILKYSSFDISNVRPAASECFFNYNMDASWNGICLKWYYQLFYICAICTSIFLLCYLPDHFNFALWNTTPKATHYLSFVKFYYFNSLASLDSFRI